MQAWYKGCALDFHSNDENSNFSVCSIELVDEMEEIWKDVIGLEEYFQVSNLGNLYSKRCNKRIKWTLHPSGYLNHATRIGGRAGKSFGLRANRVVAKAFIPNPENKPEVNHINGDKTDNRVENLEWVTSQENTLHAIATGLRVSVKGSGHKLSKLSEDDILKIRELYVPYSKEFGCRQLGEMFGVHHTQISRVLRGVRNI